MLTYGNFINGEWQLPSVRKQADVINPANIQEVVGRVPLATAQDVDDAYTAARSALPNWQAIPPSKRGQYLTKVAAELEHKVDHLGELLTREEGKTLTEAKGEVLRAAEIFRFFAGEGPRLNGENISPDHPKTHVYTKREPLGVVTIITPWNFPMAIPAWKLGPALVSGNTVVWKPAMTTPLIAFELAKIFASVGLPAGVLNCITGSGSQIGDTLVTHSNVDGISFTGSYLTGKRIYQRASERMIRVQLEMGGKNCLVVLDDSDLHLAVEEAVKGGFGLTGQACTATSLLLVSHEVHDQFLEMFIDKVKDIRVGPGLDPSTSMGPAASEQELAVNLEYVEKGKREGAKLVFGGRRLDSSGLGDGYFMQPTIFDGVTPEMSIAREEIFGPVVGIIPISGLDEALEIVNASDYGLTACLCTQDIAKAHRFADEAAVGMVHINQASGLIPQAPFGGVKHSSSDNFREQGQVAVDFYTRWKTVYMRHG